MTNLESLCVNIIKNNKLQASFLRKSIDFLEIREIESLEKYLSFLIHNDNSIEYLASCYNLIVKDTLREQIFFRKNNKYRYTTFNEVSDSVYFNPQYMEMYMYGLALTSFLWPNHIMINRWFLQKLPKGKTGQYLEIGPGHGYNFMNAMKSTSFNQFNGIDISPKSVQLTRSILEDQLIGQSQKYKIIQGDFLNLEEKYKYDAIVMGEVLEHVEKPEYFLTKINRLANKEAFIYISTAINSPAVDHIYLFESVDSVREMVQACGFFIIDQLTLPYPGLSLEQCQDQKLTINIALVLQKHGENYE
ncbi:MAG: class I SAM-dependent methyltransferase [Syntrophomonas sp.]